MSAYQEIINVGGRSESFRERELSNFSDHSFSLRGYSLANVEAFAQGIKHPEDEAERYEIFQLPAREAKRRSPKEPPVIIEWEGQAMRYRSIEHFQLQAAAIFVKFDQNEEALEALLATGYLPLEHDLGYSEKPNTCLPAEIFTKILTETREYFFREMGAADTRLIGTDNAALVTPRVIEYSRSL